MNKAEEFRNRAYEVRAANVPSEKAQAAFRFQEILQLAEKASNRGEFFLQVGNLHENSYVSKLVADLLVAECFYISCTMIKGKDGPHYGSAISWNGPPPP